MKIRTLIYPVLGFGHRHCLVGWGMERDLGNGMFGLGGQRVRNVQDCEMEFMREGWPTTVSRDSGYVLNRCSPYGEHLFKTQPESRLTVVYTFLIGLLPLTKLACKTYNVPDSIRDTVSCYNKVCCQVLFLLTLIIINSSVINHFICFDLDCYLLQQVFEPYRYSLSCLTTVILHMFYNYHFGFYCEKICLACLWVCYLSSTSLSHQ